MKKKELTLEEIKPNLYKQIWAAADALRGKINADEYKNYILGVLFYRYLSDRQEKEVEAIYEDIEKWEEFNEEDQAKRRAFAVSILGYFIEPKYLFSTFYDNILNKKLDFNIEDLIESINLLLESTQKGESEELFEDIFEDMVLDNNKLGSTVKTRSSIISRLIIDLGKIDFEIKKEDVEGGKVIVDKNIDLIGDAYEYLIANFAAGAGSKSGEFYTPQEVGHLMGKLIATKKKKADKAGDFAGGSGSLLLTLGNHVDIDKFYYQELIRGTYNLARMNMIIHDKAYDKLHMVNDDSLENPAFVKDKLDVIVANPPYSLSWDKKSLEEQFLAEDRFADIEKLPSKSYADLLFLLTMYKSLNENGMMTIVLPHGVLFRGGAEASIREYLVKENAIDAVIGLPEDIFFGTGIPTSIIVLRKNREEKDILFIDAKDEFVKKGKKNSLEDKNIDRIVEAYKKRKDIDRFASVVEAKDLEKNDYNFNIPRYVDTFEPEEDIDVKEAQKAIIEKRKEIRKIDEELDMFFEELGLLSILEGDK